MDFDEYQFKCGLTRMTTADTTYAFLNLAGEVGEVLSLEAKIRRDGGAHISYRQAMKKELGDVLWHIAILAKDHGFSLSEVAEENIEKLKSRMARNQISGNGDNR